MRVSVVQSLSLYAVSGKKMNVLPYLVVAMCLVGGGAIVGYAAFRFALAVLRWVRR